MNIFALDLDPKVAARKTIWKKHIVKMPTESAQMLSFAIRIFYNDTDNILSGINKYSKAHAMHPCAKWVRESSENFNWLVNYSLELNKMYEELYGKIHKTVYTIHSCLDYYMDGLFDNHELTPFYCAMPTTYYHNGLYVSRQTMMQSINSYKDYYKFEKLNGLTLNDVYDTNNFLDELNLTLS